MARLADWQCRLAAYLSARQSVPFHWATNSCLTFVTGAVTAMTGRDPWADDRAALAGLRRGHVIKYMERYGEDLVGATTHALALADIYPTRSAGEGDVVHAQVGKVRALGVCLGRLSAFAGKAGLVRAKPVEILDAWRVI